MSGVTLPPLKPQSRGEQRKWLHAAHDGWRWIIGVQIATSRGTGYAKTLLWVPAMLPSGYIPTWRVHGDTVPPLLQLEAESARTEGLNVEPFLLPPAGVAGLEKYCQLYEYPSRPRRWRCEHCEVIFVTFGPFEPDCCAGCGRENDLLNEE